MIASVGSSIVGSGTVSTRTSWVPCQVTAFMRASRSTSGPPARGGRRGLPGARPGEPGPRGRRAGGRGAVLSVLRRPAFRNVWLAQATSVIGDRLVVVALALFVTDLTGRATDVGLVLGAQTLPLVAFLLIGGVWADRLPRARADDRHRPRAGRPARAAGRPDLHRPGGDLAPRGDRGAVRHGRGVLPPRLHRAAAAHRAGRGDPAGAGADEHHQHVAELAGPALATVLVLGRGRRLGLRARRRRRSWSARSSSPACAWTSRPRAGGAADPAGRARRGLRATSARARGCG